MQNPRWDPRLSQPVNVGLHDPNALEQRPGEGEFNLASLFGLLRRQARLIAATVLIICALTALVVFQLTPLYSASTLIIVDPRQQYILDPASQAMLPSDSGRVDSEVEILRSPSVFLSVVRSKKLFEDAEFAPGTGWRDWLGAMLGMNSAVPDPEETVKRTVDKLRESTSVSRLGLTYLITVTASSKSATKAAEISNAIATAYIDLQVAAKVQMVVATERALASRLQEASSSLREAEGNVETFITANVDNVGDATQRQDLAELRRRIDEEKAKTARLSEIAAASQADMADRNWSKLGTELDSAALKLLADRRSLTENAIAAAGDSNQAIDLQKKLAELDAQLADEGRANLDRFMNTIDASKKSVEDLSSQLRDRVIRGNLPKEVLIKLYEVQQEANASRSIYQDLLNRSKAVQSQGDVQVPDSRVASPALPPTRPSFPRKAMFLGIAGLGSLLLGLALAFLRENYVGGFVDEGQVEQVLKIPVASSVPRIEGARSRSLAQAAAETVDQPLSVFSEAMRRARLALELGAFSNRGETRQRIILVTSSLPDEGKTLTAVSLARSLSLAGRKVLLIDCDLRRPTVHEAVARERHYGLADYLRDHDSKKTLDDLIVKDDRSTLHLILGARGEPGTSDTLFQSDRFADLLGHVQELYDYVVLDSSPVLPVVDVRLLLAHVDAVMLVVRWAATSQRDAGTALSDLTRLNRRGAPIASGGEAPGALTERMAATTAVPEVRLPCPIPGRLLPC